VRCRDAGDDASTAAIQHGWTRMDWPVWAWPVDAVVTRDWLEQMQMSDD